MGEPAPQVPWALEAPVGRYGPLGASTSFPDGWEEKPESPVAVAEGFLCLV